MLKWHRVFLSELITVRDSRDQSAAPSRHAGRHIHERAHKDKHTAGSRLKRKSKNTFPGLCWTDKGNAMRWGHDGITMRYCSVTRHHGSEGRGGEVMENSKGCGRALRVTGCVPVCVCVWLKGVVYFDLMSLRVSFVCNEPERHITCDHLKNEILFRLMQLTNRSTLSLRPRDPCSTFSLPGVRM